MVFGNVFDKPYGYEASSIAYPSAWKRSVENEHFLQIKFN